MGYIPPGAKWYLAEILEQMVHTNLVLIRADSPEEAHQQAMKLGAAGDQSYENPAGKCVTFRFRGLRDLGVINGELQHGMELRYTVDIVTDDSVIAGWVTPKEELGVFCPIRPSTGPNYISRDIFEQILKKVPTFQQTDSAPTIE
jgi:hypothetical protein